MSELSRVLRYLAAALVLSASLALLAGWWIAHSSLPQLDGDASLPELKQEVTVDRDRWGVPRIHAGSLEDLVTAQGYVVAQDRLWQMDLLRRAAAGELSEIFGGTAIEVDRDNRVLGLKAAAEKCVAETDAETRGILQAYARGVNRYIEERRDRLPVEFRVLKYAPRPWTPADSLLVGAYMYKVLTNSWEWELKRERVMQKIGPELARELYVSDSPLDHPIVGNGLATEKFPAEKKPVTAPKQGRSSSSETSAWASATRALQQFEEETEFAFGSNNWVLSGEHTYSGKPLLANDTHLELDVPCIWYMAHLTAPGWNVKGFALPGVPLIIIGHNERIAWGFTNNGADVQDLYVETFNPENPREYKVNGKWVAAEIRKEVIRVKGGANLTLDVAVTRHGPVVHREGTRGYALRWTATDPGGLAFGYPWIGQARNWEEFRAAMRRVTGPAQNAVYADVDGNIGYQVGARIPVRKNGHGEVPVPGDTDEYEWAGFIPFEELPTVFNPPGGIIATANARVIGPEYKHFLTENWMSPYRTDRLYALLDTKQKFRPQDCITIQTDLYSLPHRMLAEHLHKALEKHPPKDVRTRWLIDQFPKWNGRAAASAVEMSLLEFTRRIVRRKILEAKLGDQTMYRWWRSEVFIQNVLRDRPAHWLPPEFANAASASDGYDELLIRSADEAVLELERLSESNKIKQWRWGRFMLLEILHPLARGGFFRRHLSIGPITQSGSSFSVKQSGRSLGPAMRFVADLANLDNSLMNITMGQSGQYLSRHYKDQFPEWYESRGINSTFSDATQEKTRIHRLRLRPTGGAAK
ncbi:MAG: penicillin acylase family protein [Acidobacteria bacterium]|nr:penicillin acylase family protein [Acidobacteriota bacterium]